MKEGDALLSQKFIMGILLATGLMFSFTAAADNYSDNTPIEVALVPPLQIPGTDYGVTGLRLSVVGLNREVRGLDLALLGNITKQMFKGIAISGLFNYNRGGASIIGLQLAGVANINTESSAVYGMQLALYNSAGSVYGLQIGLINVANSLHGLQIGLVNINRAGPFHISPIINVGF